MARWANEDAYDALIRVASQNYAVPFALVKAIIGAESAFRPNVDRPEPAISDKSIGLMQILYATAKGEGYKGTMQGLYDPATNITYGVSYLKSCVDRAGGNIRGAISAYNGGWRPHIGFGQPVTTPMNICLARDTVSGKCISSRYVPTGEYANQPYVNKVLDNMAYFEHKHFEAPTVVGRTSPPLGIAHYDNESEVSGRVSGTPTRTPWTQIREALTCYFNKLCKLLRRNN